MILSSLVHCSKVVPILANDPISIADSAVSASPTRPRSMPQRSAIMPRRRETVALLIAAGANAASSYALLGACAQGDVPLYEFATGAGALDQPDRKGNRCLHFAAEEGRAEIVTAAIAQGVDPNVMNVAGQTPLDVALVREHYAAALVIATGGGRADKKRFGRSCSAHYLLRPGSCGAHRLD